jgi:hypothetical protein
MKDDYAFPRVTQLGQMAPGMELRDWFAGMAINGILANPDFFSVDTEESVFLAYGAADLMIEIRNKEQK